VPKRIAILSVELLISFDLVAATPKPYPNELNGMRFYACYLAPLCPLRSDTKQVEQVLGSDQRLQSKDWKIAVLYSCKEDALTCSHGPRNDPLDTIVITPNHRVSMSHVKFPPAFAVSYGGVSEINVTCAIFSDAFGLEYWVVSSDFGSYKKGDLLMIRYGPPAAKK
jgi:hypothetical protein